MSYMTINLGPQAIHIDAGLGAVIEFKADGLYLRAADTAASGAPVNRTGRPRTDKPASATLQSRRQRIGAAGMIRMAVDGAGPVEMWQTLGLQPTNLKALMSGKSYYQGKGGNLSAWEEYYDTHRATWDRIIRAGWQIPKSMLDELEAANRAKNGHPDIPF